MSKATPRKYELEAILGARSPAAVLALSCLWARATFAASASLPGLSPRSPAKPDHCVTRVRFGTGATGCSWQRLDQDFNAVLRRELGTMYVLARPRTRMRADPMHSQECM